MKIHHSAFIHPKASLHGAVEVGEGSNIWPFASLRADFNAIKIGNYSSIQDCVVIHCTPTYKVSIGDWVVVGHGAVIHGSEIGDNVLVGMRSLVLDGAKIGSGVMIAAGSVLKEGMEIPPNSFVSGNPATVKPAKEGTRDRIQAGAVTYHLLSRRYLEGKETYPLNELLDDMKEWEEKSGKK